MLRAALLDFDGTLVTEDYADLLARLRGKHAESEALNAEFRAGRRPGVSALVERINLLDGVTLTQVEALLAEDEHLMPGAAEFCAYLHEAGIVTIVASGSIVPVLKHFQRRLGIDHVVGTEVELDGNVIRGVSRARPPVDGFKLAGCMSLLTELGIPVGQTVAIGDSPADAGLLLHAGLSIAINPVGGVEAYADHVIGSDLREAIPIVAGRPGT